MFLIGFVLIIYVTVFVIYIALFYIIYFFFCPPVFLCVSYISSNMILFILHLYALYAELKLKSISQSIVVLIKTDRWPV